MSQQPGQWPIAPSTTAPQSDRFANPAESAGFSVIVEQLRGAGEGREWRSEVIGTHPQRTDAQAAAARAARDFTPRNPMMPQGRSIWRITPDEYLVNVQGMTADFHFRVTVGELLRD